ncbi:hypothetical protein ES703_96136 [subsurface metagenome]
MCSGQKRCHANFGDGRNRCQGNIKLDFEVLPEQTCKLPAHLEPKRVHPYVSDLAVAKGGLNVDFKNIALPNNALAGRCFLQLGQETACDSRSHLRVALPCPDHQLFDAVLVVAVWFKVVPAALHVAMMGVEQAPWLGAFGIRVDYADDGHRGVLQCLFDAARLQQNLRG